MWPVKVGYTLPTSDGRKPRKVPVGRLVEGRIKWFEAALAPLRPGVSTGQLSEAWQEWWLHN